MWLPADRRQAASQSTCRESDVKMHRIATGTLTHDRRYLGARRPTVQESRQDMAPGPAPALTGWLGTSGARRTRHTAGTGMHGQNAERSAGQHLHEGWNRRLSQALVIQEQIEQPLRSAGREARLEI